MNRIFTLLNFLGRHKCVCVFVFFALLIGVLDSNSLLVRMGYRKQISQLQSEIRNVREASERDSVQLHQVRTNIKAVHRVAREVYYMTNDNEDLFVFTDPVDNNL